MKKSTVDETSVEGVTDLPYTVPNLRVQSYNTEVGVPILWWRSVGHTHTAFVVESLIDELLEKAGKDPVEGRLKLLEQAPRETGVLKRVAEMADWGGAVPAGRKRGVAVHKSFHTYVAEIAEVSIGEGSAPRVHRVWCAVDCGIAVNPDIIKAQMEGGIGYRARCGAVRRGHARRGRTHRAIEFPRLPIAADQRDAGGRSGDRPIERAADRCRRARHAADRAGSGQCLARADRTAGPAHADRHRRHILGGP